MVTKSQYLNDKMTYDDLGTFPLNSISYNFVTELPRNVSKRRTYSVRYYNDGLDIKPAVEADAVYARLVNYKNRVVLYLYELRSKQW